MSTRTLFAALLVFSAAFFGQATQAIDADQIIEPNSTEEAADDTKQSSDKAMSQLFTGEGSSLGMIFSLLGYGLIVGGLAVALWYLFKRGMIRKPFAKGEGKLNIAETRMLGNRQFIMVVEYEQQKILLGVGPGKIDYLTNLSSAPSDFSQLDKLQAGSEGGIG